MTSSDILAVRPHLVWQLGEATLGPNVFMTSPRQAVCPQALSPEFDSQNQDGPERKVLPWFSECQVIQFVTFLSPIWRSLNLYKGHLTV